MARGKRRGLSQPAELIKGLKDAEEELKKLHNENRLLKKLAENLDGELRRYRTQPLLEEILKGYEDLTEIHRAA